MLQHLVGRGFLGGVPGWLLRGVPAVIVPPVVVPLGADVWIGGAGARSCLGGTLVIRDPVGGTVYVPRRVGGSIRVR